MSAKFTIGNKTWAELQVGDTASIDRICALRDLINFAHVSGDMNPLTLPSANDAPEQTDPIAPAMWVGSLFSAVLGNVIPGPGTLQRSQNLSFLRSIHIGDRLRVMVTCREKRNEPLVLFETKIVVMDGTVVCEGVAEVEAPTIKLNTPARELPPWVVENETVEEALSARLADIREAVRTLLDAIADQIEQRNATRPNEPEALAREEVFIDFLEEISKRLTALAQSLDHAGTAGSAASRKSLIENSAQIARNLGTFVAEGLKENRRAISNCSIQVPVLATSVGLLHAFGVDANFAAAIVVTFMGVKNIPSSGKPKE